LATAGTTSTVYTVPAARTAVFRLLILSLTGTGTGNVVTRINSSSANPLLVTAAAATPIRDQASDVVLNPGDTLQITVPASVVCYVSGFGSLLDGAPS
jgi:hypothetical protein